MIRDFFYKNLEYTNEQFIGLLAHFGLHDISDFVIVKSQDLSPDSFIWLVSVNLEQYIVYAEDYISSVQYTEQRILEFTAGQRGFFIPWLRLREKYNSQIIINPENVHNMPDQEWIDALSITSGYDSVFLYKLIKSDVALEPKLLCLSVLRAFNVAPPNNLVVLTTLCPSPHNQVFVCQADKQKYYILNDDTTGDNKNYILSQLQDVSHTLKGELLRNLGNEPDGAVYPVGVNGSEYFLFKVAN